MISRTKVALLKLSSWTWVSCARLRGVKVGDGVRFNGRPIFKLRGGSRLAIGDGSVLNSYRTSNPLLCAHPVSISTTSDRASIAIGDRVGISSAVISAAERIEIGAGTLIGAGAMIIDNDFHEWDEVEGRWSGIGEKGVAPVMIGENVFIGARAIILKGVSIGSRAVIGAGAVVVRDVPEFTVVAGNPAKVVGQFDLDGKVNIVEPNE